MAKRAHRDYGNEYPSVTTILGVLRKIELEFWFKNNTAQFCNDKSRKGKEIGKQIHEVIESFIEQGDARIETQYDYEVKTALKSFMKFRKEHSDVKLQKAEIKLLSKIHNYNGTLDCIAKEILDLILLDWKTGECKEEPVPKIYPEEEYQLSAYFFAYNETHEEQLKKGCILKLAKDEVAYNYQEYTLEQLSLRFNEVFLPCLKIYNFQKGVQSGHSSRQRNNGDSKGVGGYSQPSTELPSSF